ncbi:HAD family hydrolase [Nonomuraea sp. NPDC004702]
MALQDADHRYEEFDLDRLASESALFDLDRTLIDLDDAITRWAQGFAEQHHLRPEDVAWLVTLEQGLRPHREVFFNEVREHFALAASVEGAMDRLPSADAAARAVLSGVLPESDDLRTAGWRVGIVTNGMADNQLGKLRRTGLLDVADGYAVSGV